MPPRQFERHPPQDAFDWADRLAPLNQVERLSLVQAAGRMLADDVSVDCDLPTERKAAVDGFALRSADTLGANDYNPLPLSLRPATEPLRSGETAAVSDGVPLPDGADAVLPIDQAEVHGDILQVASSVAPGDGVALAGEQCRSGDLVFSAGRRLRPQDLALLALTGLTEIPVRRPPAIRIALAGRFDHDANGPMLTHLVGRDGGQVSSVEVTREEAALVALLGRPGADLVLVAGGTGFSAHDYSIRALQECGTVQVDGVAIHPGDTTALGHVGSTPVVLLPGTPLACLCAYDLIGARAIRHITGRCGARPYRRRVLTLSRKLVSSIGRMELARIKVTGDSAEPIATAEGRILATAIHAEGFVVIPELSEGYGAGSTVDVYLYDEYD